MEIPLLDGSTEEVKRNLTIAMLQLSEACSLAPLSSIQNYDKVADVCMLANTLVSVANRLVDGDVVEAESELNVVHQELSKMLDQNS